MRVKYSFSSRRTGNIENIRKQREKFPKLVRDMIKICDVILEVLDARFINETRNLEIENLIKEKGKKIIYVLNKADLVDINKKKDEIKDLNIYPFVFVSCKDRLGVGALRDRIKMEVKRLETNYDRAQVGVIGYPNAGKSSLINVLVGRGSAKTASEAGFTKGIQRIRLSSNILILDTPGVIPSANYSVEREAQAEHAKVGARNYDKVQNPEFIVSELFDENKKVLNEFYGLEAENSNDFLENLGKKRNLLLKGGVIDLDRAARVVLKDWQFGKIKV